MRLKKESPSAARKSTPGSPKDLRVTSTVLMKSSAFWTPQPAGHPHPSATVLPSPPPHRRWPLSSTSRRHRGTPASTRWKNSSASFGLHGARGGRASARCAVPPIYESARSSCGSTHRIHEPDFEDGIMQRRTTPWKTIPWTLKATSVGRGKQSSRGPGRQGRSVDVR